MWTATLWEARANMIAKYGYNTGNDLILRLVVDGMKLGPASPNYLQARDAILLADRVNSGGANFNELWAAFKKRGMGWNATCPPGTWAPPGCGPPCPQPDPPVLESFDLPPQGSPGMGLPDIGDGVRHLFLSSGGAGRDHLRRG